MSACAVKAALRQHCQIWHQINPMPVQRGPGVAQSVAVGLGIHAMISGLYVLLRCLKVAGLTS